MRAAAGVTLFSGFCAELFGAAADATMPVVAARAKNTFKHFIAVSIVSAHPVSAACAEVYSLVTTTVHFAKIVRPSRCRGNATLALARAKRLFALHCPDKNGPGRPPRDTYRIGQDGAQCDDRQASAGYQGT
jgi:hypothetical protein